MNVLSLFDGMSCGRIALERAGIKVDNYYASEIDKHAILVSKDNWKDVRHVGDVTKVSYKDGVLHTENGNFYVGKIDLLIGGSPCQDFSMARTMGVSGQESAGLLGKKSSLFYHYMRLKDEVEPTNFLLENVRMKKDSKSALDSYLGVSGVEVNSSLVSFQHRRRYYWSSIPFNVPSDRGVSFQDFKEVESSDIDVYRVNPTPSRVSMWRSGEGRNSASGGCGNVTHKDKVYCLTTKQDRSPNSGLVSHGEFCRYLTRGELEQAQTVPLGYTKSVSYNQAQAVLGNGWTVDVIAHILMGLVTPEKAVYQHVQEDMFKDMAEEVAV